MSSSSSLSPAPVYLSLYGTEQKIEVAWEQARWPDGFRCHVCEGRSIGLRFKLAAPQALISCRLSSSAPFNGPVHLEANKLPLTTGSLLLTSSAKPRQGISSLALSVISVEIPKRMFAFQNRDQMQAMKERDGAMSSRGRCRWMMPTLAEKLWLAKPGPWIENKCRRGQPSSVDRRAPRYIKLATVPHRGGGFPPLPCPPFFFCHRP